MQVGIPVRRMTRLHATAALVVQRSDVVTVGRNNYHYFSTKSLSSSSSTIVDTLEYALDSHPKLVKVPSLPYVGSMIPLYSGTPPMDLNKLREVNLAHRKKYGDFYSIGIPGFGEGKHGTMYMISDPREYMKVIRSEGKYPSGLIENIWPMIRFQKEHDMTISRGDNGAFFGRGNDWKTFRSFIQTDLLSPQAAAGYISGVIKAAELASKGAPYFSDNLNVYLNRCAFDMFCTVMFGEIVQSSNPNNPPDPVNMRFVQSAVRALELTGHFLTDEIFETLIGMNTTIKTKNYKMFEDVMKDVYDTAKDKIRRFKKKYEAGELNELETSSYLARAFKRLENQKAITDDKDIVTEEMMMDACGFLLMASVDTTSGVVAWALLHAALNPAMQERLYEEIRQNMNTGHLTADVFNKRSNTPYFHAFLRESHRVTPTFIWGINKQVTTDIEIHGETLPANSRITLNNYCIQMDPCYVDNPDAFLPDRWLPGAVQSRVGTPNEVIDHPFFKDPFSQGARKCPGSRVAMNEILFFLSQLILDYEIRAPPQYKSYSDVPYRQIGVLTPIMPKLEFIPRNS